jgi:hypothetical protein
VVILDCLLGISQKIGGTNKTMEIGESKFDGLKCNRELKVKGQCVFVGVERKAGKYISSSRSGENHRHVDGCSS